MERFTETALRPSPRTVRHWQCMALLLFCGAQQGCLCGCAHRDSRNPSIVAKAGSDISPENNQSLSVKSVAQRMESLPCTLFPSSVASRL